MNTPVKRAKSTALGKQCNPSRGPIKLKGHFSTEKWLSGAEKDYEYDIIIYIWFWTIKRKFLTLKLQNVKKRSVTYVWLSALRLYFTN